MFSAAVEQVLEQLDWVRSRILSRTLRFEWLRALYRDRERRTLALFSLSLVLNFWLVLFFPKILFYGTPLLMGVPHLFASFLYSKASLPRERRPKSAVFFYAITFTACASALLQNEGAFSDPHFFTFALALVASLIWIRRRGTLSILSLTVIAAAIVGFTFFPVAVATILLFGHNFMAFAFWYRSARTPRTRASALRALAWTALALLTLALLPLLHLDLLNSASTSEIARLLLGDDSPLVRFGVQAFLVTQSLHYLIWLKAIPDAASTAETPGGFEYTARNLARSLGKHALKIGVILALSMVALAAFYGFEAFRLAYLALAAYHGLFEIAAWCGRP